MKTLTFLGCLLFVLSFSVASGQGEWKRVVLKTTTTPTVIDIPAGKVLESTAVMFDTLNGIFEFKYDLGGGNKIERGDFELLARPGNALQISQSIGMGIFVGPSEMSLRMKSGSGFVVVQYRLLDNPSVPTSLGSSLEVPAETTEPVVVRLQGSTDLEEWSTLASQTVGSASINRYFRIAVGE